MEFARSLSEAAASSNTTSPFDVVADLMGVGNVWTFLIIISFVLGYLAIILEHLIHVNKSISAILMAVFCWTFIF